MPAGVAPGGEQLWGRCLPLPPAEGQACASGTSCDLGQVPLCLEDGVPAEGEAGVQESGSATRAHTGPPRKGGEEGSRLSHTCFTAATGPAVVIIEGLHQLR